MSDELLKAATAVVARYYHVHSGECYEHYEPCRERHRHIMTCGGRLRICHKRESDEPINRLHAELVAHDQQKGLQ